ncbi:hypothetical protein [Kocuria rosea]|jgi:hypothetical protein|uniref:hypothetical protein n=1 Tax=Kocuria rosea TaxID=1275 RepID=UPI00203E5137|nr:hypothetical protein [Kocuria rosea]MCM3688305.1 hypothetical protein [Kocuria rosea]
MQLVRRAMLSAALAVGLAAGVIAPAEASYTNTMTNYFLTLQGCQTALKRDAASVEAGATTWYISSKPCTAIKPLYGGTVKYRYVIVYGYN